MDQVTHQVPSGFVWPTVGHPGLAPLWALAPNPRQPRTEFDPIELDALADTMRPEHGGEQREIVTVRDRHNSEQNHYDPAVRYVLISGERRWRASTLAGQNMIEIRVKRYKSVADEKLDMFMLNENRVGLSDIESARYAAELAKDFGWQTQAEMVRGLGKTATWVQEHVALLKLSPEAQDQMLPSVPHEKQLKLQTALFVARYEDHSLQNDLLAGMPRGRTTAGQQVGWLKQELERRGIEVPQNKMKPSILRQVLGNLLSATTNKIVHYTELDSFATILDNTTPAQREILFGQVKTTIGKLEKLLTSMEELIPGGRLTLVRPQTGAPARESVSTTKPPADPKPARTAAPPASPKAREKPEVVEDAEPEWAPRPRKRQPVAEPFAVKKAPIGGVPSGKEKTISVFSESAGRKVTDKVGRAKYLELWDKNLLGFQWDEKPRPDSMPTREQAEKDWDAYCD